MVIFLILFVVICNGCHGQRSSAIFYKVNYGYSALRSSESLTDVPDKLGCVTQCMGRDSCNAFTYDQVNSTCIMGFCVVPSASNDHLGATETYQTRQEKCSSTPGFRIVTSGSTSACLWLSDLGLNYTDAREDCRGKGASLMTLKTINKLSVAQSLYTNFYVGLDDIGTEGTFVWDDDLTVVNDSLKKLLFYPGQPDNFYNVEDCAMYTDVVKSLNDIDCRWVDRYACEKPCFEF